MPKAARERIASPRAGTALAHAPWPAGHSASESSGENALYVTNSVTNVNISVTRMRMLFLRSSSALCIMGGKACEAKAIMTLS